MNEKIIKKKYKFKVQKLESCWMISTLSPGKIRGLSEDLFECQKLYCPWGHKQTLGLVTTWACHMKHLWNTKSHLQLFTLPKKELWSGE